MKLPSTFDHRTPGLRRVSMQNTRNLSLPGIYQPKKLKIYKYTMVMDWYSYKG